MHHLYLSPHFDDAVLSCGGMIHRQTRSGERVIVATICAGVPDPRPISPYAARLHARWGYPPEAGADTAAVVAQRRAEDAAALARLGVEGAYLDVPDVIYRRSQRADWVVHDDASLFSGFHPGEDALVDALATRFQALIAGSGGESPHAVPIPTIYAPLGVGNHADHALVRRAAERWAGRQAGIAEQLVFYEDYPYAADQRAIEAVIGPFPDGSAGSSRPAWHSTTITLDEADLVAKIEAIAAYASQISSFWVDTAAMADAVRVFAGQRGRAGTAGERVWRPWVPGG